MTRNPYSRPGTGVSYTSVSIHPELPREGGRTRSQRHRYTTTIVLESLKTPTPYRKGSVPAYVSGITGSSANVGPRDGGVLGEDRTSEDSGSVGEGF